MLDLILVLAILLLPYFLLTTDWSPKFLVKTFGIVWLLIFMIVWVVLVMLCFGCMFLSIL
jgi:hypothetical protein